MADAPTFIVSGARSGSTLLRFIVDAHPDVACPPETDVALVARRTLLTATALYGAAPGSDDRALALARRTVEELVAPYLAAAGARRWCDKSLTNAEHLPTLARVWPDARFVLLHRHCMDVIDSILEASPWGLMGYGLEPYAATAPSNMVAALSRYWVERTSTMLDFESAHPDRCCRLTYEALVADPAAVAARLWAFMGVRPVPDAPAAAFGTPHAGGGPGDFKIWYTDRVGQGSVGRGRRVPAPALVPGPMLQIVNDLLQRLGHDPVGPGWGEPVVPVPADNDATAGTPVAGSTAGGWVGLQVVAGPSVRWRAVVDLDTGSWAPWPAAGAPAIDGPVAGRPVPAVPSAWVPAVPSAWVEIDEEAFADLCAGAGNIGTALRRRAVRSKGLPTVSPDDERRLFARLAAFLRAAGPELAAQGSADA